MSDDLRPRVALPRDNLPMPLLIALAGLLGLAVLLMLRGHQAERRAPALTMLAAPDIPPLPVEQERPAIAVVSAMPVLPGRVARPTAPMAAMPYAAPYAAPAGLVGEEPLMAHRAPAPHAPADRAGGALVLDLTQGGGVAVNGATAAEAAAGDDTVRAAPMRGRATVIAQGAVMEAVLETPLNSDRPGLARAIVGEDVRGFDGSRILIPRGSRLLGEFKADTNPGQRRVLVTWTRLIRPDGVAIRIASPAVDPLGGAGVPGAVNSHFVERFSAAVLQSALAVGVNLASTLPVQGAGSVYLGLPSGQAQQMGSALIPGANRAATVKVKEGTRIAVLVAHDLDFAGTPAWR